MRRDKDKGTDKLYGYGLMIWMAGCAGMAEHITSGRGSFLACAVIFSVGLGMIIGSYLK